MSSLKLQAGETALGEEGKDTRRCCLVVGTRERVALGCLRSRALGAARCWAVGLPLLEGNVISLARLDERRLCSSNAMAPRTALNIKRQLHVTTSTTPERAGNGEDSERCKDQRSSDLRHSLRGQTPSNIPPRRCNPVLMLI